MVKATYQTADEVQAMLLRQVDTQIRILQEAVEAEILPREKTRDVIDSLLDVRSASSRLTPLRRRQKATA